MKVFNLPRGSGKSTRLLYASEFTGAPILCKDRESKEMLIDKAKQLGINIPEPICVHELMHETDKILNVKDLLVDEVIIVLQEILKTKRRSLNIIGLTMSDENNMNTMRVIKSDGYTDVPIDEYIDDVINRTKC